VTAALLHQSHPATQISMLVLGGTGFLGPAFVTAALRAGYTPTLFNRGISHPGIFPHLERIRGFRSPDLSKQDLSGLKGRRWDVVVDVWPHDPDVVESAASLLAPAAAQYVFVSSVAAYDGYPNPGITEKYRLRAWRSDARGYEADKAESERRLHNLTGPKLTVVRPGPIKGDGDGSPDLVTWLLRARNGGRHIGPGDGADAVQFVDVKDVGNFMSMAVQHRYTGAYNLTGDPWTFHDFLQECESYTQPRGEFIWIPRRFLTEHGLKTDFELGVYCGNFPFWRPEPALGNLFRISSAKAYAAGWQTRPFSETAHDCLVTFGAADETPKSWKDFLSPSEEQRVLLAWQQVRLATHP
jgi:2'-hydroxyisoflavone reductase